MDRIGTVPRPAKFRYWDVFFKGKPQHETFDPFRIKHPNMDTGRRAKIFAPFDALKGFREEVSSRNTLYEPFREVTSEEAQELNRQLTILHNLTYHSRIAEANRVQVSVTYYEPCTDEDPDACRPGRYLTVSGICRKVDRDVEGILLVDCIKIPLASILQIEAGDLFDREWET